MKVAFGVLNLFDSREALATVFERLLTEDNNFKASDMARSILISSFVKPAIASRGDPSNQEGDVLLTFILDVLYPKTLDVLSFDAPHILEMTQQLQASLNLYLLLKTKYKENSKFKAAGVPSKYFENIRKAI